MPDGIRVDKTVSKNRVTVGELLEVSVRVLVESDLVQWKYAILCPRILNWWKELITVQCGKGLSERNTLKLYCPLYSIGNLYIQDHWLESQTCCGSFFDKQKI